jgi:hypothetical protein
MVMGMVRVGMSKIGRILHRYSDDGDNISDSDGDGGDNDGAIWNVKDWVDFTQEHKK